MANAASPRIGGASLQQLRDTLMGEPKHPPSVTHREVGSLNQVGGYLHTDGRRLTL